MTGRTMVFKIGKPATTFAAVNYNSNKADKKKTAKLVHFENFGYLQDKEKISKEEFRNYLQKYSARNSNIKKPQFHGILSSKGRIHDFEELKKSALEIMYKLGYEGNPILIYEHHDTDNNHVHIVTTRVDIYGKKIKDSHEKRRAVVILNDILSIKPNMEWEMDLSVASGYRVANISQFLLLLELKGYQVQKNEQAYHLYKYGKLQGMITAARVEEIIVSTVNRNTAAAEIKSMRAIIKKYQQRYNGNLIKRDSLITTSKKDDFRSNLTEFLSKNFGWQFVFFVAKGKEYPYGYAIIDHKNKQVYKGSEIISLNALVQNKTSVVRKEAIPKTGQNKPVFKTGLYDMGNQTLYEPSLPQTKESSSHYTSHEDSILASLIDEQLYRLDIDAKEDPRQRKKRKRKI